MSVEGSVRPPGHYLADLLQEDGLSLRAAATRAGLHPVIISAILCGETAIGPAEAAGLARLTSISSEVWFEREKSFRMSLTPTVKHRSL